MVGSWMVDRWCYILTIICLIIFSRVISALDRANVSSRNAMFIIAPVLSSVGVNVEDTTLSYRTIQRTRMLLRKDIAIGLKDNFKAHDKYVVHWDRKILNDNSESKFVDRLPIILTAFGTEQLLGVPKMNSGSAENQTATILSTLNQWGIISYIKVMCFDTTAVNTGIHHGTCKEIEKALGKELIWLPCRHHIYEIILRSAFEVYWLVSSGPNVPIFGRFKNFGTHSIKRSINLVLKIVLLLILLRMKKIIYLHLLSDTYSYRNPEMTIKKYWNCH
ncbi:uncharacterized protein LOC141532085 [Cotesia typhae]|uniref:uncharacterized protein LOC141532085 n=1 Tax=Cotesia typhae TaxID=2053667 RepID=UPI003D696A40